MEKISNKSFYNEYHGHNIPDLQKLLRGLRIVKGLNDDDNTNDNKNNDSNHSFVWLVGDSSLDNKYWIPESDGERACNGYEKLLTRPNNAIPDIAHCLNRVFEQYNNGASTADATVPQRRDRETHRTYTCINCSVEESTVGEREDGKLFPQDEFVRDNMSPNDILVVSLGGNDIALKPSKSTIASMGWLAKFSRTANVVDGSAWGLGHFHDLLHAKYQAYLDNITSKCKPKLIVPCMIYHLDENPKSQSWANRTLELIGYNSNPKHVQAIIHRVFLDCMINDPFKVAGVKKIHPIELSRALDGSDPKDYDNRVEPSAQGGRKIADFITSEIFEQVRRIDEGIIPDDVMKKNKSLDDDDDQGKCMSKAKKLIKKK